VYRPRALAATTTQDLANVVHDMLGQLRDVHAWLITPTGSSVPTYTPTAFVNWRSDVWQQYVKGFGWQQQTSNWGYARVGGVPYFAFGSWNPAQFNAGAVDAELEQFKSEPAIIIDVRMNGGGSSALADSIAARFFDTDRIVRYVRYRGGPSHSDFGALQAAHVSPRGAWQFRKPVLLLVGRGCFSSTEDFIAAMSQLPNVTMAGDTTGGGSGNPALFDLGSGWQYSVPRWIEYTASMQVVEWNGIAPNVVVPTRAADFDGGVDPVLDYAARWAATVRGRAVP
jgi:C-terminal processing protease CtpA/Prc